MPGLVPGIHVSQHEIVSGGYVDVRYGLTRLVCADHHDDIAAAIQRENTMKHGPRGRKASLVVAQNLDWDDLCPTLP